MTRANRQQWDQMVQAGHVDVRRFNESLRLQTMQPSPLQLARERVFDAIVGMGSYLAWIGEED